MPRPLEYGPDREIDTTPDPSFDVVTTDFKDLADRHLEFELLSVICDLEVDVTQMSEHIGAHVGQYDTLAAKV